MTAAREAMLHDVHEEWAASTTEAPFIARSAKEMRLTETVSDDEEHGDGIIGPRWKMELLGSVELTDATDDFDFIAGDLLGGPLGEFVYLAPDGEFRTDVWLSNQEEVNYDGDIYPREADSDKDGLTDGQEVHGLTIVSKLDTSTVRVTGDGKYDIEPDNPDSDGDDALDGGGAYRVDGQQLGREVTDDDRFIEEGEVYDLPTDPGYPDVVEIVVATDEEFRDNWDHKRSIRHYVERAEYQFNRQFDRPIHFAIVHWEQALSDDTLEENDRPPREHLDDIEGNIDWPVDRYGADILVVFSHQAMGRDVKDKFFTGFADGIAPKEWMSLIVGTNDMTTTLSLVHDDLDATNHLFQHELWHIFGAVHPTAAPDEDDDTNGIMCKESCISLVDKARIGYYLLRGNLYKIADILNDIDWLFGTNKIADYNIQRMKKCRTDIPFYDDGVESCRKDK